MSLRNKILSTYLLVFMVFVVLMVSALQRRHTVESQLRIVERGLMPALTLLDSHDGLSKIEKLLQDEVFSVSAPGTGGSGGLSSEQVAGLLVAVHQLRHDQNQSVQTLRWRLIQAVQEQTVKVAGLEKRSVWWDSVLSLLGLLVTLLLAAWALRTLKLVQLARFEKLALVGQMAAQITHEIKNPLHSLGLNLEILREDLKSQLSNESEQRLHAIEGEINRLNQLAQMYLHIARPAKGSTVSLRKPSDLNALVEETLFFLKGEAESHGVELIAELHKPLPNIAADSDALRQALLNLVKNAIEAASGDGGHGHVWVKTANEGHWLRVVVEDDGPGVGLELMPRLFEAFYTTKSHGTGLGLAMTQKIVFDHHGKIACHPASHGGLSVVMLLPKQYQEATKYAAATV